MAADRTIAPSWRVRLLAACPLRRAADVLAAAVAVSLPWSTSGTNILTALWLAALIPTLELADIRRVLRHPAAYWPVALVALAAVGVAWADAPINESLGGLKAFWRLLTIPLLMIQFERSPRGWWAVGGFLASCVALLAVSFVIKAFPALPRATPTPGVPVKDYVVQSGEFLLCAFGLAHVALTRWGEHRRGLAVALAALAALFLLNIVFVATSRTSVIVFAALLVVFGLQRVGLKGTLGIVLGGAILGGIAWASSPYLRSRVIGVTEEIRQYETDKAETSSGYRIEFWKKSVGFIAAAPVLGHGTGSTAEMFRRARTGTTGIEAAITTNPHNQVLLIAIELGAVGVAILLALWLAHGLLFAGAGLAAWLGMAVVVQNVVSSAFNAQLFYFTPGWTYMLGVGVLGGLVTAARAGPPVDPAAPPRASGR